MEYQIVPPNLNCRIYKEFYPSQKAVNTFLDFIDVYNDNLILGSSNLNGRYWDGSICLYRNISLNSKLDVENYSIAEFLCNGVTDGKFISENKVIISEDSGQIKLFEIEENNFKLCRYDMDEHEDVIKEISFWNENKFVSCSADGCIKLWSLSEPAGIQCTYTYNHAHSHIVSSVAPNKNDINQFVSCSYDRSALLWDTRTKDLGKIIYTNEFCALTRCAWHPTKTNMLTVCNSSGDIYLIDVREPHEFVTKNQCFNRSIHRTQFNKNGLLAVCADDCKLMVLDCTNDEMNVVYVDHSHNDFVRGLAWKENDLISCGWDKQVIQHYI